MSSKCNTCARNKGGRRCNRERPGVCTHYRKYMPNEKEKTPEWENRNGVWSLVGDNISKK